MNNVVAVFLLLLLVFAAVATLADYASRLDREGRGVLPVSNVVAYGSVKEISGRYVATYLVNFRAVCSGDPITAEEAIVGFFVDGTHTEVNVDLDQGTVIGVYDIRVSVDNRTLCPEMPGGYDHFVRVTISAPGEPTLSYIILRGVSPTSEYEARIYIPDGEVLPYGG